MCQTEEAALQEHRNVRQVSVEVPGSHLPSLSLHIPVSPRPVRSAAWLSLGPIRCSEVPPPSLGATRVCRFPNWPFSYHPPLLWFVFYAPTNEVLEYQGDDEMALLHLWPPPPSTCTADGSSAEEPRLCRHAGLVRASVPLPCTFCRLEEYLIIPVYVEIFSFFSPNPVQRSLFYKAFSDSCCHPTLVPSPTSQSLTAFWTLHLAFSGWRCPWPVNHTHGGPRAWSVCGWHSWALLISSVHVYAYLVSSVFILKLVYSSWYLHIS